MAKQYERIADELRQALREGVYPSGSRLPAETALKERFKVSLPTLRQAMSLLEAEGFIERQHGRGTFVRKARMRVRRTPDTYQWEKDRARLDRATRLETGNTERQTGAQRSDLDFFAAYEVERATDDLATAFGLTSGAQLLHRTYRTKMKDENSPLSLIDSYLPYELVAANPDLLSADNEPWPGGTQSQLYTIGIELDRIEEEITARPPLAEEVEKLELPAGTAILAITKTSIDTQERVVEISKIVLPGDRAIFAHVKKLVRWEN